METEHDSLISTHRFRGKEVKFLVSILEDIKGPVSCAASYRFVCYKFEVFSLIRYLIGPKRLVVLHKLPQRVVHTAP